MIHFIPHQSYENGSPAESGVNYRQWTFGLLLPARFRRLPVSSNSHFVNPEKHRGHQDKAQAIQWAISVPAKPILAWREQSTFSRDSGNSYSVPAGFQVQQPQSEAPCGARGVQGAVPPVNTVPSGTKTFLMSNSGQRPGKFKSPSGDRRRPVLLHLKLNTHSPRIGKSTKAGRREARGSAPV